MRFTCRKCVIREWTRADKESLIRFANNRNVWRNLTHMFPHPYTEAHAEEWFCSLERRPEPTHWAIEVEGHAVGGIGVTLREGIYAKSALFGYWLGEPFWGRGIMTEAVNAVSRHILAHFGLVRLESPVFAWNPASMRVLEKCGFVREAVLRSSVMKDGQIIDQVVYAFFGEAHDQASDPKGEAGRGS